MKKICIAFVSAIIGITGFAQGQVHFKTHITSDIPPVDARVFLSPTFGDVTPATDGFGQLFIKNGSS